MRGQQSIFRVGDPVTPTIIVGEEDALDYYNRFVEQGQALILNNGQRYPGDPKTGSYFPAGTIIKYCIDRTALDDVVLRHSFMPGNADLYSVIDEAFGLAAASWNAVLGVTSNNLGTNGVEIRKAVGRDNSCVPTKGDDITWYIRPATQNDPDDPVEFLTYVLHPKYNLGAYGDSALREAGLSFQEELRELKIWEEVLVEFYYPDPAPFGDWFTLQGLMLHTIAQGLGFINESTRNGIDANYWKGDCSDPTVGGIFLTVADPWSVTMHPQSMTGVVANDACRSQRPFDYAISYMDAMGAACQYVGEDSENLWLYYCNRAPQEEILAITNQCSPVPVEYGASNSACPATLYWSGPAKDYTAAIMWSLRTD
jgi:hypothetical protein